MQGYSHSDRLKNDAQHALQHDVIQKRVCNGENIFGMLPEIYDYPSLIQGWKGTLQRFESAVSGFSILKAQKSAE